MTSSWKFFRWRSLIYFQLVLTIYSSFAEEILEFNGRSFSPPKYVDNGNWIPSSLLTFSEHWVPMQNEEKTESSERRSEPQDEKKKNIQPSLFESIGNVPTKTTQRPLDETENVTWFVKTKEENRRIMSSSSDSRDLYYFQPSAEDFEYLESLKNHKLVEESPKQKYPHANNEPIYGRLKELPSLVYTEPPVPSTTKNVQYLPNQYSKLKEELQHYYQVPFESQQSVSQNVGASLSFGSPSMEQYGQFSLPRPYFDVQKPSLDNTKFEVPKEPSIKTQYFKDPTGAYYPGLNSASVPSGKKPLVVGMTAEEYDVYQSLPESVPSDLSLINSPYGRKPPFQLSNKPQKKRPNKPQKMSMMDRVMEFIYNFQERQGINGDKFPDFERPNRNRPSRPSGQGSNRPSLRPQYDQPYREPYDYGNPSKPKPVYQKPNSLVDRMVEAVHTYFQCGYAANKRKPHGAEKVADGGLGSAPIGAVGLAAALASVIWYGVSKGTTPVVTARQEGSPVDMEALFANIDKLEEVIDNVEFMEKYSKRNSSFADMVQELISHLAQKDGQKLDAN